LEESRQTDRPKEALGEMPPFSPENDELDRYPDESDEHYAAKRALFE
jgi:hypothetical protein